MLKITFESLMLNITLVSSMLNITLVSLMLNFTFVSLTPKKLPSWTLLLILKPHELYAQNYFRELDAQYYTRELDAQYYSRELDAQFYFRKLDAQKLPSWTLCLTPTINTNRIDRTIQFALIF